jgi:phage baseplate assembly protein W
VSNDPQLLRDLGLELRHAAFRPVYAVATSERRLATRQGPRVLRDLATVSGRENLAQAIMIRLLTPRGELSALGHPEYGSRLPELIGRENTEATRNLVRFHILESLAQEPRIEEVIEVAVTPSRGTRDRVDVRLAVRPIGRGELLRLGPFTLEL